MTQQVVAMRITAATSLPDTDPYAPAPRKKPTVYSTLTTVPGSALDKGRLAYWQARLQRIALGETDFGSVGARPQPTTTIWYPASGPGPGEFVVGAVMIPLTRGKGRKRRTLYLRYVFLIHPTGAIEMLRLRSQQLSQDLQAQLVLHIQDAGRAFGVRPDVELDSDGRLYLRPVYREVRRTTAAEGKVLT